MNFWVTEITHNCVSISNLFFTCIATWSQGNAYRDKEPDVMLLWTFWPFGFKLFHIMPINIPTNTIGSKIWDIVRVTKFKTKSKRMALLITKQDENYIEWVLRKWKINWVQKNCCDAIEVWKVEK